MPANVETMAYTEARGVPWHGMGTPVDGLMTATEAIEKAGLDWEVALEPIMVAPKHDEKGHFSAKAIPITSKQAVVRQSDRSVLGVVGTGYSPVQNVDAFDFADQIVASNGNHFETAGSLDGGRTIWLSVDLSGVEPIRVAGDTSPIESFLLLSNTHDGTKAVRATVTPVRVVCQNTLNLAFSGAKGVFNVRHSGDIKSKMAAAREALGISIDYMRRFEEVANTFVEIPVDHDRAEKIMRDVFEMREETEEKADTAWFENHHATKALEVLMASPTIADDQRNTGWGVLNAVAEYIDHDRTYGKSRTDREALDVKMTTLLWGKGADVLNRTAVLIDPKAAALMDKRAVRTAARVATRVKVKAA